MTRSHALLPAPRSPRRWCYRRSRRSPPSQFQPQGEGRVAAVLDARSLRLEDGRETASPVSRPTDRHGRGAAALSAVIAGRDVTLHGVDDAPDRYGRQPAFVFLAGSETPVQSELLSRGEALVRPIVADKDCASVLAAAEARARQANRELGPITGRHKKRGNSGRYLGRDWAFYSGRGHGFVRSAGGGDHLPEFRAELDMRLCCDYFKAHDSGVRSGWAWA